MLIRKAEALFSPVCIEIISEKDPAIKKHVEKSAWYIRDNTQLSKINHQIKSSRRLEKFCSTLDTGLAVTVSYLAASAGTAPTHFPIFSSSIAGNFNLPDRILLQQDEISSGTISEFLSNFLSTVNKARPKFIISYHHRPRLLELLSKVSSLVYVTQRFGKNIEAIKLDDRESEDNEVLNFVLNGNHLPNLKRYLEGDESILLGWAAAKSIKLLDVPGEVEKIIKDTIQKVVGLLENAEQENKSFWLTLYIQLLLDLAFFTDGSGGYAQRALLLARQLDSIALIAHCQRFANQTHGVGSEALAILNDSIERFKLIPENSESYLLLTPSRLAAILNRNTTMLISGRTLVDPGAFESDFLQAKEVFPSYSHIGMLASAAAVASMVRGNKKRAVSLLEQAVLERSMPIDGFNIRMNLLCAQYNYAGSTDEQEFQHLCEDVQSFTFPKNWEYHQVRIASNLLTVATSKELEELAWSVIAESSFLSKFKDWGNKERLRDFLIRNRYLHYLQGRNLAGQFGRFSARTGLFPCIDKDWA